MGEKAAGRIRAVCNDQTIVSRHLSYKRALIADRKGKGLKISGDHPFPAIAAGDFFDGQGGVLPYPYSVQGNFRKIVSLVTTAMISPQATILPIINQWRRNLLAKPTKAWRVGQQ